MGVGRHSNFPPLGNEDNICTAIPLDQHAKTALVVLAATVTNLSPSYIWFLVACRSQP